jgi:hypothetical protein
MVVGSAPKAHPPPAEIPISSTWRTAVDGGRFCAKGASASGGDPDQLHLEDCR